MTSILPSVATPIVRARPLVRMRPLVLASLLLGTLGLAGCAEPPDAAEQPQPAGALEEGEPWVNPAHRAPDPLTVPQATSLLGEELFAMEDTTGAIAAADSALAEAPDDVELLIEAGRVRRNFWQYRQAMELYSRAAELAPDDWRPYRFRGHRHISLRDFDAAIVDLEAARERAPLNWDVAYHLGLAYFLAGRFDDAADEYLRCLELADDPGARAADADANEFRSCAANGNDAESLVAMAEWATRALARAGRHDEVVQLLDDIPSDLPVTTNVAYLHTLRFQKGEISAEELLNPGEDAPYRLETVGFAVANQRLVEGDTAGAREILERLMDDPWWPGFGRIAAEADLARLGR